MATDLKALSTPQLLELIWVGIRRYKASGEWKTGKITAERQQIHDSMDEIGTRLEEACPDLIQQGYQTKVGKGVGRFPNIPWISLLPPKQTTSSGIYGVACINGDGEGYVVGPATSVSDKEISRGIKTIKRPKAEIRVDVGDYNDAFASFKEVTRAETPENDIVQLIIKAAMEADKLRIVPSPNGETETPTSIEGPREQDHAELLLSALAAKPFAILAGGTGTGKTRTAIGIAEALVGIDDKARKNQIAVVSVQADWTDKRSLLGYRNMLSANGAGSTYVSSEAVRLMLRANADKTKPFFLILDEMNLSYVERYFADFLSSMESKKALRLHDREEPLQDEGKNQIPQEIEWPSNLFIIGTVNIDETTYQFSPKVLDRAHVIEFKVTWEQIENGFSGKSKGFRLFTPTEITSFVSIASTHGKKQAPPEGALSILKRIHAKLSDTRFEFSHRTAHECARYALVRKQLSDANLVRKEYLFDSMDTAILQKVLPKLNGAQSMMDPVLSALLEATNTAADGAMELPRSHAKLIQMQKALERDQFISFIQ
jgi:5-methylcytosine-specific restriction protein B